MQFEAKQTYTVHKLKGLWLYLFGSEISRFDYLSHILVYSIVYFLSVWPSYTFLWTMNDEFIGIYQIYLTAILVLLFCSFLSSYVRATNGQGFKWYRAIFLGFICPFFIILLRDLLSIKIPGFLSTALSWGCLIFALCFPLVFSTNKKAKIHVQQATLRTAFLYMPAFLLIASTTIIIPIAVYAGLYQDGIWVGRGLVDSTRFVSRTDWKWTDETVIATCADLKGVSAYSYSLDKTGFKRDNFDGTKFSVLLSDDGSIDVVSIGESNYSYRKSGFKIIAENLAITNHFVNKSVDRFVIHLSASHINNDGISNTTTLLFSRFGNDEWDVIMTTARSRSKTDFLAKNSLPFATGSVMVGPCNVRSDRR